MKRQEGVRWKVSLSNSNSGDEKALRKWGRVSNQEGKLACKERAALNLCIMKEIFFLKRKRKFSSKLKLRENVITLPLR